MVSQKQVLLNRPISLSAQSQIHVLLWIPYAILARIYRIYLPPLSTYHILYCKQQPKNIPFPLSHHVKQNGYFHLGVCKPLYEWLLSDPPKTISEAKNKTTTLLAQDISYHMGSCASTERYLVLTGLEKLKTTAEITYIRVRSAWSIGEDEYHSREAARIKVRISTETYPLGFYCLKY